MNNPLSPQNNNPWFGVSMVLIGVIVGYSIGMNAGGSVVAGNAGAGKPTAAAPTAVPTAPSPAPTAKDVVPVDPKEDHIMGDPDALVSVIEYSDFECPFCKRHHPTMQALVDANEGKVNWVYRHFPLQFHPNAQKASEASECAGDIGGNDSFWDYTDLIFEKGPAVAQLEGYASELGLDAAKFKDCLDSGKFADKVKDQMAGGSAGGVSGTPGNIIINNKTKETRLVSGAQPLASFQAAVDDLL